MPKFKVQSLRSKVQESRARVSEFRSKKRHGKVERNRILAALLLCLPLVAVPIGSQAQEINPEGFPIPDLAGLTPYSIGIELVDAVEKIVERFYTPAGGHVARLRGNGKVFAYAVDNDRDPPIDYLLIDLEGSGRFTKKIRPEESYLIPEWVSR